MWLVCAAAVVLVVAVLMVLIELRAQKRHDQEFDRVVKAGLCNRCLTGPEIRREYKAQLQSIEQGD